MPKRARSREKSPAGTAARRTGARRPVEIARLCVESLHRAPAAWDGVVCEIAKRFAERLRSMRGTRLPVSYQFVRADITAVACMLARSFDVTVGLYCADAVQGKTAPIDQLDAAAVDELCRRAQRAIEEVLRKTVEDTTGEYPPRPDPDLDRLVASLTEPLPEFLRTRCMPGGDLHARLQHPTAIAVDYFKTRGGRGAEPRARSRGSASRDVYELGLVLDDADGFEAVKKKLIHFARTNPWLSNELSRRVRDREDAVLGDGLEHDLGTELIQVTDDFIFSSSAVDGLTPIELLLRRSPLLGDAQRRRVQRMSDASFVGVFQIESVGIGPVEARLLRSDKRYRLDFKSPEAYAQFAPGDIMSTRVSPWDERWMAIGLQRLQRGLAESHVNELTRLLRMNPPQGPLDRNDPLVQRAFELQREQHDAFVQLFGADELLFENGLDLAASLQRFHRYWSAEMIDPRVGKTHRQAYIDEHGQDPPLVHPQLPEELLDSTDVGILMHPQGGLLMLQGYRAFRAIFEGDRRLTRQQVELVWEYLRQIGIDFWVFHRMRDRWPQRAQDVLRQVLCDETFDVHRDLDRLLMKFKGDGMRYGFRPSVAIFDPNG